MRPVPSIGDTLREARMRQRLDIAEVEAKTKIRAKYLRALENEEFDLLPGPTFVKTFLRTYAEQLGLDPHRLVEEYCAKYEPRDEVDLQPLGPPAAGRERRGGGPPRVGIVVAGAVLAVLAFLVVLGLTGEESDDGRQAAETAATAETRPAARPKRARERRPAATSVTLRIAPSVPTYVCLDRGPGTPVLFEGILESPRTFRGKLVRVNLGKTSVDIRRNGRRVPLEPSPNPAGFSFTPKGAERVPIGERPCA